MAINTLPDEILARILSFLPRVDRLESALTCRRWAQTVARAPPLLRDTWVEIEMNRQEEAAIVFADSHRQYENLRLFRVSLSFNAAFWTNVGPSLRKLEIVECEGSSDMFYSILEACSKLESLKIRGRCNQKFKWSALPPGMNLGTIQNSMCNLRHLHLEIRMNADNLQHLLTLMPNLSSIALLLKGWKPEHLSRLRNMLESGPKITILDLSYISSNDFEQLLRISAASLRTLKYHGNVLAPSVLDALRNCSMLRELDLIVSLRDPLDPGLLKNILRNVPELECLTMDNRQEPFPFIRDELMPIFDLKKLRKLDLFVKLLDPGEISIPNEIVRGISRMISLESLTLKGLGIVDSTCFRIFASLPNLQELVIDDVQWDAECLRIILFDLEKLRKLDIRSASWEDDGQHAGHTAISQDCFRPDRQGEQRLSSLEVLKFYGIPLTDACLSRITVHHGRLKIVSFMFCAHITGAGVLTLCQQEPLLEEVGFLSKKSSGGTFLEGLGRLCRRLRRLSAWFPDLDSRQARREFESRRPGVKCVFL